MRLLNRVAQPTPFAKITPSVTTRLMYGKGLDKDPRANCPNGRGCQLIEIKRLWGIGELFRPKRTNLKG